MRRPEERPVLVRLRLSEPATGRTLELQAAWPAGTGMILDPGGVRLDRNQPISVEALQGWRVLTPEGMPGDLQLQLRGHPPVSLPIGGEVPLASHLPLIQAMLAQGGPDAQVNLSLVVSGREGPRLEIRRYHDLAVVEGNMLRMGQDRDEPVKSETALASQLNKARRAILRAVDLSDSSRVGPIETGASVDLGDHLGQSGGPWLVQSTLEGRVQRAAVWNPRTLGKVSREDRIDAYAEQWRNLVDAPEDPDWDRSWQLISAVQQDGDSGVLDQVQAFAKAPVAAIALALSVPGKELSEVLSLEAAAPLFWPALAVSDFAVAIRAEHKRQRQKLAPYLDETEAGEVADGALVRRIGDIVSLRPELAGHLCSALIEAALLDRVIGVPELRDSMKTLPCFHPRPSAWWKRLPGSRKKIRPQALGRGRKVGGLKPLDRPVAFPSFNSYAQAMIDAPLVVAEMAAERRAAPSAREKLVLVNLRLIDPLYFDTALPAALALSLSSVDR